MNFYLIQLDIIFLFIIFALSLILLSKAADVLVNHAVVLSKVLKMPEMLIGATIVSIGTTLPELSTSLIATLQGSEGFALGNAIGSTITNTCLVLGIGAIFGAIPVNKRSSNSLKILLSIIIILIVTTLPSKLLGDNAVIPKYIGVIFIILIPLYIYNMIRREKIAASQQENSVEYNKYKNSKDILLIIFIILLAAFVVTLSASFLTSTVEIIASRLGIPDAIIASTIVAFGTSVPELSTTIASAKSGHGELALGNVLGANILNVLLVLGSSVVFSKIAVTVPSNFYWVHFPAAILILILFSYFVYNDNKPEIRKKEGFILLGTYAIYLLLNISFL